MNIALNTYYFTLLLVAIATTFIAFNLHKKYPIKYISVFFYYLFVTYICWILVYAIPELLFSILGETSQLYQENFSWLIVLFCLPVTFIAIYFFMSLFANLRNGKIPKCINFIFIVVFIIYFMGMGILFVIGLKTSDNRGISIFYRSLFVISMFVRFGVIVYAFMDARKKHGKMQLKLINTLCYYYFTGFLVYCIFCFNLLGNQLFFSYLKQFIYLFLNIPPLFFLKNHMNRYYINHISGLKEKINLEILFEKYNLTQREREIFLFLLKGKSNTDIKNKLNVSIKTVKNHVYNIYKKMGIGNRIQLLTLLQDFYHTEYTYPGSIHYVDPSIL
jgi:DNA-binding CsgD family transcriptional regulator